MTDDESRKAFAEWSRQYYGYEHAYPADADAWQAAAEWATKREREKYAMLNNDYRVLLHDFRECKEEIAVFSRYATQEAIGEISALKYRRQSILGPMGALKEQEPKP